jgi:hypothetical protein
MKKALSVVEITAVQAPCKLEFDEYVPLRLRTYDRPIGANYVRLGNYSTTLLELIVEPNTKVLRGVTVTSYEVLGDWPDLRIVSDADGLPVLSPMFDGANRVDLEEEFRVSVRKGEVLVFWGDLGECSQSNFAQVHCLVHDGQLRGIRFSGLSDEESKLFASHAQQGHASHFSG